MDTTSETSLLKHASTANWILLERHYVVISRMHVVRRIWTKRILVTMTTRNHRLISSWRWRKM